MPSEPCWIKFACHTSRVQQVQQSVRTLLAQQSFEGSVKFSDSEHEGSLVIFWADIEFSSDNPDGYRFLRELDRYFPQDFVRFDDWEFPKRQVESIN
ncbi:MAG: hypothetical protein QG607_302 [Patescibacteria group bacterium]|nr:hypothetical protein [Patescibacteria group bacterium]